MSKTYVAILDFGSQYNQLIARRIRECRIYCEILPFDTSAKELKKKNPSAIFLSGGPASVVSPGAPKCDPAIFKLGIPILGICYGLQLMGKMLGGKINKTEYREYGRAILNIKNKKDIFFGLNNSTKIWMSHGDYLSKLPAGFENLGSTKDITYAAIRDKKRKFYGVQFHPEVTHTVCGIKMIKNFLFRVARCSSDWTMHSFVEKTVNEIKNTVKGHHTICAMSGGVDSSVAAFLTHKALGEKLHSIFVDNGLLPLGEKERVERIFKDKLNLKIVDAKDRFLKKLFRVVDPEKKRKIIGKEFIKIFEEEAKKLKDLKFLVQGTLYPDVIESQSSFGGPSAVIKSHHNVGGLPKKMKLKLIEPLKYLFKDEVRILGKELHLPNEVILRQPFPGPGLAVRILGEVTEKRLDILKKANQIVIEEIIEEKLYNKIWQSFAVMLPLKTVGVMGDERTYENIIALRAVESKDGMTADWVRLPYSALNRISTKIINEVKGINRVVYDISTKPPSTIEWE
jgi:GMP synthase (glutamine-hydrolysing)